MLTGKTEFMAQLNTPLAVRMGEIVYDNFFQYLEGEHRGDGLKKFGEELIDAYLTAWTSAINHASNSFYNTFGGKMMDSATSQASGEEMAFFTGCAISEVIADLSELINVQHKVIQEFDRLAALADEFNAKVESLEMEEFERTGTRFGDI